MARHRDVSGVEEARVGDHLCWAYADDASFHREIARYVRDGLAAGQRVACFFPERSYEATRAHLEAAVPGLSDAVARGVVVLGTAEEAYLPGGRFDPDVRVAAYAEMAHRALAEGFEALRIMGEATEIVNTREARDRWPGYEVRADLLAARLPVTALCAYDTRRCDPAALALLRAVHPTAFGDWDIDPDFTLHAGSAGSLALGGEVDAGSSHLVGRISREAAPDMADPVLDVTELRFIDVSGVRAVAEGARAIADAHSRVRIRGAGPTFVRIWNLLACDEGIEAELVRA